MHKFYQVLEFRILEFAGVSKLTCLYAHKDCKCLWDLDAADVANAEQEFEHWWEHQVYQHLKLREKSTSNNYRK